MENTSSPEFLGKIINAMADPVFVKDRQLRIILVNDAFCQFDGRSREELIGKTPYDLFPAAQADVLRADAETVFRTRQEVVSEERVTNARGIVQTVVTKKTFCIDDEGRELLIGVLRDVTKQKQLEQQLSEALAFQKALLESAPIGIVCCKGSGEVVSINAAAARIAGGTVEKIMHVNFRDVESTKRSGIAAAMEEVLTTGREVRREFFVSTSFGVDVCLNGRITPFTHEGERYVLLLGADITERKLAEMALRTSEERYRVLFNSGNDAVFVHAPFTAGVPGKFVEVNDIACRRLGYTRQELLEMSPADIDAPEMKAELPGHLARLEAQGHAVWESFHVGKDGLKMPVEIDAHPFQLGSQPMVLCEVRDLRERKQAELVLRESEAKFRAIFNNSAWATAIIEPDSIISMVNDAYCKASGYARHEVVGKSWQQTVMPEDLERLVDYNRRRLINPKDAPENYEFRYYHKNGEVRHSQIAVALIQGSGQIIASMVDITQRRQAEETLRESESKFSKMFHASPLPMALSAIEDGRYLDANDEFLKMLERSREEVIGHTSIELKIWVDLKQRAALVAKFQDHGSVRNFELAILGRSGQVRQILWSAEEVIIGGQRCWLGSALDITERKQAEESLRASETFVRNVLDSLTAHIAVLDEHGKIVAVNQAWHRFARENGGSDAQVLLGANYLAACQCNGDLQANESAMSAAEGLRAVMDGKQTSFHLEYPCHSLTTPRWFLMHIWPLGGTGKGVVVAHENITERKQTERLLSFIAQEGWSGLQEDFLARLVQYIGLELGVAYVLIGKRKDDHTVQTTGLYAKGGIVPDLEYSTRGAPCENVLGKMVFHSSDHLQEMFPEDTLLAEMGAQSYLGIPLTDSAGKPLGLMAVLDTKPMPEAQVATAILQIAAVRVAGEMERLAKVDELRWKTALMEAQMEAAPDGILVVDNQGRRVLQNQRMNDLLKIPPHIAENNDDFVEREFIASQAKNPRQFRDKVAHLFTHPEEVGRDEIEFRDGTIVDRYSSPVRDRAGKCLGRIWTFRDLTQARQLEAQLRQSQKMEAIGQLAGGVAHDFNNILSALLMQTDLIEMIDHLPGEAVEGLKQLREDVHRAAGLTRQLLLFSRRQVMQSSVLDLNDIVNNLTKMLQRIIGEDVRLQLHLHAMPLMTRADAGMVEQVLMNLAVNARDAMPEGGQLRIETKERIVTDLTGLCPDAMPGRYVCVSVSDTGGGIPPEIMPRIFEPFFTTKEAGKGTGLGLATVFGIVKQHQGWIEVDNQPGKGVAFGIFLPASSRTEPKATQTGDKPRPRGGSETILLVEDELRVRKSISTILKRNGYDVVAAANGSEALELWGAHRHEVALLLTDLVMPGGMKGHELARQLQSAESYLKVVYMSGYSAEIAGRDLELRSGENFVQKPFLTDHLLETIRRSLDAS
jgi:PAS domain S-box-containing protein